jgi:hypothetical protein
MGTRQERTLGRSETTVTKAAVIIGAILLLAGVATAGTVAGLSSSDEPPTVSIPAAGTTTGEVGTTTNEVGTTTGEDRRENELRGRANEPGEDVRGPCDELEHANDPRCTGVQTLEDDDRASATAGAAMTMPMTAARTALARARTPARAASTPATTAAAETTTAAGTPGAEAATTTSHRPK